MSDTNGLNHLGLSVFALDKSVSFFVDNLGWEESGRDDSYPRAAVSDGLEETSIHIATIEDSGLIAYARLSDLGKSRYKVSQVVVQPRFQGR